MPIRPTSRLDLHLLPPERGSDAERAAQDLFAAWVDRGHVTPSGAPGPHARALCAGGFARARVDLPGRATLYANQVGGFHVRCPACATGLARQLDPFGVTSCPSCGGAFPFDALDCRPPAGVAWASVVLHDIGDAAFDAVPPGWRRILRRPL